MNASSAIGQSYSNVPGFEMDLPSADEWTAKWIGGGGLLRKEFPLRRCQGARAYISVLGLYELRINGRKVGDHVPKGLGGEGVPRMSFEVFVMDSAQVPHTDEVQVEADVLKDCASVCLLHLQNDRAFESYCKRAAGIILWHQLDLTEHTISRLSRVQVIVRNGVGFENVDVVTAAARGIPVCNVPDYGTEEVADHTIALCLALTRELRLLMDDVFRGNWRWQTASACRRVRGQIFGIVGCGRIGTATALRAKNFGYDVHFYDPYVNAGLEKALGVKREDSLSKLLAKADVVSLHVPLTEETHHLIDRAQLQEMKRNAFLINTARGAVIRHEALENALAERWIAGAALDVLEHEPVGLDLFSRYKNCIVTPHSAFYSQQSVVEMRRTSAQIVRNALLKGELTNVVNGVLSPREIWAVDS